MLEWARSQEPPCPWGARWRWLGGAVDAAINNGHLNILKWLLERGCPWNNDIAWTWAVQHGHLDVLKYLDTAHLCLLDSRTCTIAAEHGQVEILAWARCELNPPLEWRPMHCLYEARQNAETKAFDWIKARLSPEEKVAWEAREDKQQR